MDQTPPISPTPITPENQPTPPNAVMPPHDPGKTLGIIGLVFAFISGLQLIGLILSIIGFNQSKKAGIKNTVALVGIILNAVFMFITVGLLVALTLVSYNGVSDRASTVEAQAAAASVVKSAETYYAENGSYPTKATQLNVTKSSGIKFSQGKILFSPSDPSTVEFYDCSGEGNAVGYYDYDDTKVKYLYAGKTTSLTSCTITIL